MNRGSKATVRRHLSWTRSGSDRWDRGDRPTVGAGTLVPTTYDAANRPLTQNGVGNAYGSDPDGRLTTRPEPDGSASQRLEWDSLGRLIRVRPPNGNSTIALYTYDPLDRLHLVDHGGGDRVRVRYAGLTTAAVQTIDDQSGAVIANTGTGWTASATGSVSGTIRYDPWGTATGVTGSWSPYLAT